MKRVLIALGILITGILIGVAIPVYAVPLFQTVQKSTQPQLTIQPVQSVIDEFNPSLQPMLETITISTRYDIQSSMALTCLNVPANQVQILVSPEFSTFSQSYQNDLLLHEYLNIIGAKQVNLTQFNEDLQTWYNDPNYGTNDCSSNYFKYTLYYNLYQPDGIQESQSDKLIDQYAFIGETLNDNPQLASQLPVNIQAYYKGVLN
jgi:hypothetical protein